MWNPPNYAELQKLPPLRHYSESSLPEIKIHQHYFLGSADWWVSEFDSENRLFYGYVSLGDTQMAEWGYTALDELLNLKVPLGESANSMEVDRDLHWETRPISQVDGIVDCYKAQGIEKLLF